MTVVPSLCEGPGGRGDLPAVVSESAVSRHMPLESELSSVAGHLLPPAQVDTRPFSQREKVQDEGEVVSH